MSTEQIARALHITGREARTHARKLFFRGLLATSYARKDNGQVVVLWQAK